VIFLAQCRKECGHCKWGGGGGAKGRRGTPHSLAVAREICACMLMLWVLGWLWCFLARATCSPFCPPRAAAVCSGTGHRRSCQATC